MESKQYRKNIDLILFCFSWVIFVGVLPIVNSELYVWLRIPLQFFILLYFLLKKSLLFGPSLFLLLLECTYLIPSLPPLWLFNLLISTAIYLIIVFSFRSIKQSSGWLILGRIDKTILLWILLTIFISSTILIIWCKILKPDLNSYAEIIPNVNISLLIIGIVGFAVLNGVLEEITFRGILWDGLQKVLGNTLVIIFLQSVFFGLCHYNGFPRGVVGIGLSFVYGVILGILRYQSQGLLAPILAHIFTDSAIALIVLETAGKI